MFSLLSVLVLLWLFKIANGHPLALVQWKFRDRLHRNELGHKCPSPKTQRRIPSKRSEIKVVDDAKLYINLWCIGKHRALRRKGTCNFKLYLEIGKCLSQFKALTINVETTIVCTQVSTKILPMSQPHARWPLIVVLLFFCYKYLKIEASPSWSM